MSGEMTDSPPLSIRVSYRFHTDMFLFLYRESLISSDVDVK